VIKISLDLMGGDFGPQVVIPGAAKALDRHPDISFVFYGIKEQCEPVLAKFPKVREKSVFHDCELAVSMEEKPSQALRRGRYVSTMWRTIEAVKSGEADVAVSAGNTGALMAMAMARALFELERPTVGLLNVGVEEIKGQEEVKEAGRLLREANLDSLEYSGFVEGDDLGKGTVDVVVVEGFSGNIALKAAEGTARQIGTYLRAAMSRTLLARIGYLFAKSAFDMLREKLDPSKVNGGVFLGLNGIVIKSHGGANAEGIAAAIEVGYDMAKNGLTQKIENDLKKYHAKRLPPMGPEAA